MSTRAYLVVCGAPVLCLRRQEEGLSVPCVGGLGGEQIIKPSLDALRERGQLIASGRRRAQVQREHRRRAPHRRLVLACQPDRTSEEVRGERGRRGRTCLLRGEPVVEAAEEYRMKPELTAPAEDEARVTTLSTLSTFIASIREHTKARERVT